MSNSEWHINARPAPKAPRQVATGDTLTPEAKRLLGELGTAAARLGDACIEAGFPPRAWRAPDAQLAALDSELPDVTMETLLMRITTFAGKTGPGWLAGDSAALAAFEREARMLTQIARQLRSLAERQRMTPLSARGMRPLERALGDWGVGEQLDRLAYTLRVLMELASQLAAAPPWRASAPGMAGAPTGNATGMGLPAQPGFALLPETTEGFSAAPGAYDSDEPASWLLGDTPQPSSVAATGPHWLGMHLFRRMWPPRRPRIWALGLVATLLVLAVSGALVRALMLPGGGSSFTPVSGSRLSGQAIATVASGTAQTSLTPTAGTPTSTVVAAAHLVLSPTSVILPCSGAGVTLTLSNTGGQPLTWHASASGNIVLSATSGSVGPQETTTITARASGPQHGTGAIIFTSDGGTSKVTYKVTCR